MGLRYFDCTPVLEESCLVLISPNTSMWVVGWQGGRCVCPDGREYEVGAWIHVNTFERKPGGGCKDAHLACFGGLSTYRCYPNATEARPAPGAGWRVECDYRNIQSPFRMIAIGHNHSRGDFRIRFLRKVIMDCQKIARMCPVVRRSLAFGLTYACHRFLECR